MEKLDSILITDGATTRTISLWLGSPADIGRDDPVDLIIVSALRNDYTPTQRSVIGALDRKGLSVEILAEEKAYDLRETTGFWLSEPVPERMGSVGVGRILCFEPHFLGSQPAEVIGTLFRGLFPFLSDKKESTIAMAVIATGALREEPERMLRALVSAAAEWMKRGLPVHELRIIDARAEAFAPVFLELKESLQAPDPAISKTPTVADLPPREYDVFLSFAKEDANAVDIVRRVLSAGSSSMRLFDYRHSVDPGKIWQEEIDGAMKSCRKMVAFLSPSYFASVECQEEINQARLRHKREKQTFLVPFYWRELELPLWLETLSFINCRESDSTLLEAAASRLITS